MVLAIAIAALLAGPGRRAVSLTSTQGKVVALPTKAARGTVCFMILGDCPIANGYAPEMGRIAAKYSKSGFDFFAVHVERDLRAAEALKHAKEYRYPFHALLDTKHALVAYSGASISPQAVVLSPSGVVLYCGRIDDLYYDLGKKRPQAREHSLRNALDAIVAGKKISQPRTKAVGCFMPK